MLLISKNFEKLFLFYAVNYILNFISQTYNHTVCIQIS